MQEVVQQVLVDMTAGFIVAIVGACLVWMTKLPRRVMHMTDDWFGEEGRPGIDARPGVMVRLQNIERSQAITDAKVSNIEHEVNFNSGKSIKDAVHRTDKAVGDVSGKLDQHIALATQWQEMVENRLP